MFGKGTVTVANLTVNLPNFFILGAQRAGTTSLFHFLIQHPEIYIPRTNVEFHEYVDYFGYLGNLLRRAAIGAAKLVSAAIPVFRRGQTIVYRA